jgi:hypothetical protein
MAKKNPFDYKPKRNDRVMRPDADIRNADWPKRTADVDDRGEHITPAVVKPERKA